MSFKDDLLAAIAAEPTAVREAFNDDVVVKALGNIGVGGAPGIRVYELHAPSPRGKPTGLGRALCGRNGIRHAIVTCKDCLKKL